MCAGLLSGVLDSYIVLDQCRRLRTVERGQNRQDVMEQTQNQETEGVRAKFMALVMIAALVCGLVLWFGEVYAAGLYINDSRTGLFSAFYIVPPVLFFLVILSLHANRLPLEVVFNKAEQHRIRGASLTFAGNQISIRDLLEFAAGIALLVATHNPLFALGILLMYAVITRQDSRLLVVIRNHIEMDVILVLAISFVFGTWLIANVITPLSLGTGEFSPVIPAAVQSVLWGPLYEDPSVPFWMRITTLSTGALLLSISSLVGVMLFKRLEHWFTYIKYSIPYALLWYGIMRGWIFLTLETPIGEFLDQWAHSATHL